MWPRLCLTVAMVAAAARGVSAQTETAEGVAALARGDYQRAVEILEPIAEDWRSDDPAAQFFMAGLYEAGRGVRADPLRACALYMRASARDDTPFGRQASVLFAASLTRGEQFNQECQRLAIIGFDSAFEAASFDFGPGHSVEWTLAAATVTYEGRTTRHEMPFGLQGARFLPLLQTELATGPTRAFPRHFIELFLWQPSPKRDSWELQWHVFEIIRNEITRIDIAEPLATVRGDAPPSPEALDVREHAILRVDDEGNAEWAVLQEQGRSTERIESDAERREVRAEAIAREAALKGVDWTRRADAYRQPVMSYGDADGCGNLELYGWTADRSEAIVLHAVGEKLRLSTQPASFDLSHEVVNISVVAHVYAAPQRQFSFCSDVRMAEPDAAEPEIWRAIAGTITIALSRPGVRARAPYLRRATVTLRNVVLRNAAGTAVRVQGPVTLTAIVGGVAG